MNTKTNIHTSLLQKKRALIPMALLWIAAFTASALLISTPTNAQTPCSTLADTIGKITDTTPTTTPGDTYSIWTRMKSADGTPSYTLSIDGPGGSLCDQAVAGTGGNDAWVWSEHTATIDWTGGSMNIQAIGTEPGVGIDCVVLTTDSGFAPSTKEDCLDISEITVNITNPGGSNASSDTFNLAATANGLIINRVEFFIDDVLTHTLTTAPYEFSWNVTATPSNEDYVLTTVAYDEFDNPNPSTPVVINVRHPDINRNGVVDIFDLSRLLNRWQTNDIQSDLNDDGQINIFDLSQLLGRWGT